MQEILFEHPLNERTRTLLRLSHLFRQFDHHLAKDDFWDSRAAIGALLDIAAIVARPDIKSDMLKQLDQHASKLARVAPNPNVDQSRLERVLNDLETSIQNLRSTTGQLGGRLRRNDFLTAIAQRMAIPGGSFEFDLPQFHYWLHLPYEERCRWLEQWRQEVSVIQRTVELLLGLLRNSNLARPVMAPNGLYSKQLDPQRPVELIQVTLDPTLGVFAEISGNKHRFCVRFMACDNWEQPTQSQQAIPFKLNTCAL